MGYRKFRADNLFDGSDWAGNDSVLILTADGIVQAVVPAAEAGEGIEVYPGILCPGFVNCHCHLELSHLKGLVPAKTGLVDFLLAVMRQRGQVPPEVVAGAIAAAEQEMLDGGVVAVGDICNSADTVECKKQGRLAYYNFIESMGFVEDKAPERFAGAMGVYEQFEKAFPGRNAVVPHAPYSVSPALFRLIATFAGNRILTMHSQESAAENEFFLTGGGDFLRLYRGLGLDLTFFNGTGKRSLESVLPFFPSGQPILLVHNVATAEEDLATLDPAQDRFFCLCPSANLYIGGLLPDVEMLIRTGGRLAVGTDSLASNGRLSILDELLTLQEAFPGLGTGILLGWATAGGAAALRMDDSLGSFLPGLRPGVLLLQGMPQERLTTGTTIRRLL